MTYLIHGFIAACLVLLLLLITHRDQNELGLQDLIEWFLLCVIAFVLGSAGLIFTVIGYIACGIRHLYKSCDGWFIKNPFYRPDKKWCDEED